MLAAGREDGSEKPAHLIGFESPDSSGVAGQASRSAQLVGAGIETALFSHSLGFREKRAGGGSRIGHRAPRNVTPARLHSNIEPGGQMSSFIMTISRTIFFRLLAHAPEELQREAKENAREPSSCAASRKTISGR